MARPRSEQSRRAALGAAVDLVAEGGLAAATFSAVAARAGVSRVTLYKWWDSPAALVLDGLLAGTASSVEHDPALAVRDALAHQLHGLVALLTDDGRTGAALRAVTAQVAAEPGLRADLVEHWLGPRRAVAADLLRRGQRSGEVRAGVDVEAAVDVLFAPLYHRLLFGHGPVDDALVEHVLDLFGGFA
ncbi:TetR-like C-terminal domain-containing protein [Kineococcus rhizosphaerae]|uniref:TetR family transcriptional regulator n=1 Tax=Kineococcus rhizosphaerae TaxID=559628 RepID=A0A2T0R8R3_9ACTN|nr:TetR-like C-terminal domain-containing protein [Kineococcus rhizosphaerae]PRY17557.1 TetR family transcriptional regulator [Kineococcus rhizosphaerae]